MENCLFRVPRRIFEEGELFQDMFSIPAPEGQIVDGMNDEQPLRLPDTYTKADFRRFLKVLLPLCVVFDCRCVAGSAAALMILPLKGVYPWRMTSLRKNGRPS